MSPSKALPNQCVESGIGLSRSLRGNERFERSASDIRQVFRRSLARRRHAAARVALRGAIAIAGGGRDYG